MKALFPLAFALFAVWLLAGLAFRVTVGLIHLVLLAAIALAVAGVIQLLFRSARQPPAG